MEAAFTRGPAPLIHVAPRATHTLGDTLYWIFSRAMNNLITGDDAQGNPKSSFSHFSGRKFVLTDDRSMPTFSVYWLEGVLNPVGLPPTGLVFL